MDFKQTSNRLQSHSGSLQYKNEGTVGLSALVTSRYLRPVALGTKTYLRLAALVTEMYQGLAALVTRRYTGSCQP